jgi:ADP-ribose pyrophosphatase YjhB (NUDIX family)
VKPFRFCPACGSGLEEPDHEGGSSCPRCKRSWYRNAAPTAGCAVLHDGKVLIVRRARDPEKGRFDLPGGFLKFREDPVSAVKREVREELGIEVDLSVADFIQAVPHAYGDEDEWVLALGFLARFVSGVPVPNDDVAEARWISEDEVDQIDFAWPHDHALVRKAFEHG